MRDESIARRYAAALFAQGEKAGTLDAVQTDLLTIAQSVKEVPFLHALLAQPTITEARKKAVLNEVFTGKVGAATLGFVNLLADKRRIEILGDVATEFVRMVRDYKNIAIATATTAIPLSASETQSLVSSLEAKTGKTIQLNTEVDPQVLGGVLVRIGDTVYDGTVRGNLDRLRDHLLSRH
jgi:F-type H+-transporting ATPase subunit delta